MAGVKRQEKNIGIVSDATMGIVVGGGGLAGRVEQQRRSLQPHQAAV